MAVSTMKLTSALVIKVKTGVDARGNDVLKSISLKKVKPAALEQDVFDVAQAVGALLGSPVSGYFRQNMDELVNM